MKAFIGRGDISLINVLEQI